MCPDDGDLLPQWIVTELRRDVPAAPASRSRIMARVRALAPQPAPRAAGPRWHLPHRARRRRGIAIPFLGLALPGLAAAMLSVLLVRPPDRDASSGITARVSVLSDTIDATLRDTLRLVRFALRAPAGSRVALVGDFNGWAPSATPLASDSLLALWSAVVPLGPGRHRYAFVVNDTQWVAGVIRVAVLPFASSRP